MAPYIIVHKVTTTSPPPPSAPLPPFAALPSAVILFYDLSLLLLTLRANDFVGALISPIQTSVIDIWSF